MGGESGFLLIAAIDVVKTRIQIDPALKGKSLLTAGRSIVAAEGAGGLLTGFGPTAVGYLLQGGAKFAGYELSVSREGYTGSERRKNGSWNCQALEKQQYRIGPQSILGAQR